MSKCVSIPKLNDRVPNEDSGYVDEHCIAVSDGAGGCGVFAGDWSAYLLENLDKERAIDSFQQLDQWIDTIWEPFYLKHEALAQEGDGMLLSKFYNEGSYATLAACWHTSKMICKWMTFGDSVVFHYNQKTKLLEHSFTSLHDFSNPPHLLSCKDPLEEAGFCCGKFHLKKSSVVFAASDALSHYVLMMYEVSKRAENEQELEAVCQSRSANAQRLQVAMSMEVDFSAVIEELLLSANDETAFRKLMTRLVNLGLLDQDDYTLCVLL